MAFYSTKPRHKAKQHSVCLNDSIRPYLSAIKVVSPVCVWGGGGGGGGGLANLLGFKILNFNIFGVSEKVFFWDKDIFVNILLVSSMWSMKRFGINFLGMLNFQGFLGVYLICLIVFFW